MNSSDLPSRILKAFGVNGLRNAIATDSSPTTDNSGVATFDKGFPEITMQPLSAGGIPPSGKDFNGVLYSATLQQQWYNAGMTYPFSADFSTSVGGYPKGAMLPNSALSGQWLNLSEANSTAPESPTGASTGWVPINNYGVTQLSVASASVVLSSLQAAKDRIIITGALTANINLIFPAWIKSWVVHNNCTGNFTVTCRTATGTGVSVIPGLVSRLFCDGLNISDETYNPNNDMVGMVAPFAMIAPPEGWLRANGALVSRVTYARLFSRIGTTFSAGDGSTTFGLPELRGEFIRGWDNGRGVDVNRTLGTAQKGSLIAFDDSARNAVMSMWGGNFAANVSRENLGYDSSFDLGSVSAANYIDGASTSSQAATQGQAGATRPRNVALLYCIKY